jgi:hypothetical protein
MAEAHAAPSVLVSWPWPCGCCASCRVLSSFALSSTCSAVAVMCKVRRLWLFEAAGTNAGFSRAFAARGVLPCGGGWLAKRASNSSVCQVAICVSDVARLFVVALVVCFRRVCVRTMFPQVHACEWAADTAVMFASASWEVVSAVVIACRVASMRHPAYTCSHPCFVQCFLLSVALIRGAAVWCASLLQGHSMAFSGTRVQSAPEGPCTVCLPPTCA